MATVETSVYRAEARYVSISRAKFAFAITAVLAGLAVCVQGYHPYSEDGGLYLTSIKKLLEPALYPSWSSFSSAQSHFSMFVPIFAAVVQALHISLVDALFVTYVASIWSTIMAAWMLVGRCFGPRIEAQCGAATLIALWLALPVAGTSLMLMDPYVTARSVSTPCGLFALCGAIDLHRYLNNLIGFSRLKMVGYVGCTLIAELAHPLMATYALGFIALVLAYSFASRKSRLVAVVFIAALSLAIAACIYFLSPPQSQDFVRAAQTRSYWFIDTWRWYELFGMFAPLLIVGFIALHVNEARNPLRLISKAAIISAAIGVVIAVIFARTSSASYAVARLQPLRIFQFIYLLMVVLLGAYLGEKVLKRKAWRWAAFIAICGTGMFELQRQTYPHSAHIELPAFHSENNWEKAFFWIRDNTSTDALFALDAKYISAPGEDAQVFRAIAERSVLPDYSKDGGLAAIAPALASQWDVGERAQANLEAETDTARLAKLLPFGVSWLVLSRSANTQLECPYSNPAVKVCRLVSPSSAGEIAHR